MHPRTLEQLRPLGVVPALAARADRDPEVRLHLGTREVAVPVSAGDRPRHVELDTDLAPGVAHVAAGRRAVVFVFALGERASWRILRERAALLSGSGPGGSGPGGSGLSGSGLSGSRPPTDGERTPAAEPPPPAPR